MKVIKLTKGYTTIVDDEDYEYLIKSKWQYNNGYAITTIRVDGKRKSIRMHRLIMNSPDNMVVDHQNHDRLDNRRINLRVCTITENSKNRTSNINSTSKYLGVCLIIRKKKLKDGSISTYVRWFSQIQNLGKVKHIGVFKTEIEAAIAYNKYAIKYHGEFANLNII